MVKENAYEYNRYNDPHLQSYLKRRKVKVPRAPTDLSHYYEQQQSVNRLAKRKHEYDGSEYLSTSLSPQSRRLEESFAYRNAPESRLNKKSYKSSYRREDLRSIETDVEAER